MSTVSLRKIVQQNLTRWMLIPSICLIVMLGAYSVYEKSINFEQKNSILAESINRNLSSILNDAKHGLISLSTSITRYDPFWYSWVLSNFLQAYQSFDRLLYLDPTGKLLATSPQEEHLPPTMHAFKGKVTSSPGSSPPRSSLPSARSLSSTSAFDWTTATSSSESWGSTTSISTSTPSCLRNKGN